MISLDTINAAFHSIKVSDGTNTLAVNGAGAIAISNTSFTVTQGGFASWKVTKQTANDSEIELVSTPLTGRLRLVIQNRGTNAVFLKNATGVSVNDFELPARSSVEWDLDDNANIFAICSTGQSADIRTAEFAA